MRDCVYCGEEKKRRPATLGRGSLSVNAARAGTPKARRRRIRRSADVAETRAGGGATRPVQRTSLAGQMPPRRVDELPQRRAMRERERANSELKAYGGGS